LLLLLLWLLWGKEAARTLGHWRSSENGGGKRRGRGVGGLHRHRRRRENGAILWRIIRVAARLVFFGWLLRFGWIGLRLKLIR